VIGGTAIPKYPELPSGPWAGPDIVPPEPPTGYRIDEMTLLDNAPYVIAVARDFGYALCEIAEPSSKAPSTRRGNSGAQIARNVRELRIAAGLTQTVLAKRCGINRAAICRLESGRLTPTLPTLERLAKTLEMTPRSFL
jgi:DNA-binding XRE family transcriptional regulator